MTWQIIIESDMTGDPEKNSKEHQEMVKWMSSHEISLTDKFNLEKAPRQKKTKRKASAREPEAVLDLHGLTLEEASKEIQSFIMGAKLRGYFMVKIIHGKGIHSPGEAKLKNFVRTFLDTHAKKMIVSWQLAPANQGGSGAVIVYL